MKEALFMYVHFYENKAFIIIFVLFYAVPSFLSVLAFRPMLLTPAKSIPRMP